MTARTTPKPAQLGQQTRSAAPGVTSGGANGAPPAFDAQAAASTLFDVVSLLRALQCLSDQVSDLSPDGTDLGDDLCRLAQLAERDVQSVARMLFDMPAKPAGDAS